MRAKTLLMMTGVLLGAPATAAVTAVSGQVQFQSSVRLNNIDTLGNHDVSGWTSLQPGTAFTASSSAEDTGSTAFVGGQRRYSFGNASATWLSESNGTVDFHWGFATNGGGFGYTANDSVNPNWSYTFTLSTPGVFNFSYELSHQLTTGPSTFGINGFFLSFDPNHCCQYNAGYVLYDLASPLGGGESIELAAGTHTVSLSNIHWVSSGSDPREVSAMNSLRWSISPTITGGVPEPASWAMLILGFGLTGATMRRRRTALPHVTA